MPRRKPCEMCAQKDQTIAALQAALQRSAAPTADGPSVMSQLAEVAEAETEDAARRRLASFVAGSKARQEYARIHLRDPYADCKVVS